MSLVLDVGCGSVPQGDVNTDIFIGATPHHKFKIRARRTPNFVLCDAQHLPFRDKAFSRVYTRHVLEHIPNPLQALKEYARVASLTYLITPNNPLIPDHPEHLYSWCKTTLENLMSLAYGRVRVEGRCAAKTVDATGLFRKLRSIPIFGAPLSRVMSRVLAYELHAWGWS